MSSPNKAIGGYFELELPRPSALPYPLALKYQSARAAFLDLLRHASNAKRIWMPYYICESMLAPVRAAGKEICFYPLDQKLEVSNSVALGSADLLLYVNYFGVCGDQADALLSRFNPDQVVLDFSQAFYSAARNCLATIYSPRKFVGLPDGGLLVTELPIDAPEVQDIGSEGRMFHLIKRLGASPEAGYADFKRAEESLKDMEPLRMSTITEKMLASIDNELVRLTRNQNFHFIHKYLAGTNRFPLPADIDGPLCYPYMPAVEIQKELFIRSKIYIATYWPEVVSRIKFDDFEYELVNKCIPIPCDQRYDADDMQRIINKLSSEVSI